jgi:tetratricopeptide (TPR) repeat protein
MNIFKIIVLFVLSLELGFSQEISPATVPWVFSSENQKPFFMKIVFSLGNVLLIQYSVQKGLKICFLDSKKKLLILSDPFLHTIIFWDDKKGKHVLLKGKGVSFKNNFEENLQISLNFSVKNSEQSGFAVDLRKLQTMFENHQFVKQKDTDIYDYHDKDRTIQIQMGSLYPSKITMTKKQTTIVIENITIDKDLTEIPWKDMPDPPEKDVEEIPVNPQTLTQLLSLLPLSPSGGHPSQKLLDKLSRKFKALSEFDLKDEKSRGELIHYFCQNKDYHQAWRLTEYYLKTKDSSYALHFWKGIINAYQRKFSIAIPAFEEALKIKPGDFSATFAFAKACVVLQNEESLEKAQTLLSSLNLSTLSPQVRKSCEIELQHILELKKTLKKKAALSPVPTEVGFECLLPFPFD